MFTHSITRQLTTGGSPVGGTFTRQAGAELNIDEDIPATSTDLPVAFAAIVAKIISIALFCNVDVLIEVNSSSAPANVFNLKAGVPLIWTNQDGSVWRDTAGTAVVNITSLFVTNASAGIALLQIRTLIDPT